MVSLFQLDRDFWSFHKGTPYHVGKLSSKWSCFRQVTTHEGASPLLATQQALPNLWGHPQSHHHLLRHLRGDRDLGWHGTTKHQQLDWLTRCHGCHAWEIPKLKFEKPRVSKVIEVNGPRKKNKGGVVKRGGEATSKEAAPPLQ